MTYNTGDYVRLENSNELKVIDRVVPIENKVFYVCNDNIWYDEELIYPYRMKIDIKESLGKDLTLSDFGKEDVVLSSLVDYLTDEDNSDKLEEFINELTEDLEIDMDMW